jgi:hypothetical protein
LQEQVGTREQFEELFTLMAAGHGITEGPGQAAEHAGVQQKALEWLWLGDEHFAHEILHQMAMGPGNAGKQVLTLLPIAASLQRQGEQA